MGLVEGFPGTGINECFAGFLERYAVVLNVRLGLTGIPIEQPGWSVYTRTYIVKEFEICALRRVSEEWIAGRHWRHRRRMPTSGKRTPWIGRARAGALRGLSCSPVTSAANHRRLRPLLVLPRRERIPSQPRGPLSPR